MRTAITHGKVKRQGRFAGHRSDWKKAYVRLREGEKIPSSWKGRKERITKCQFGKYKPTSPRPPVSDREVFDEITTNEPDKPLTEPLNKSGGRNNHGEITRGGAAAGTSAPIGSSISSATSTTFRRRSRRSSTTRTARRGSRSSPTPTARSGTSCSGGLKVGDTIIAGDNVDILPGNTLPLKNIPLGTLIHNVELRPGKGGQIARSAGSSVQLVAKEGEYASVRMPSGEIRSINMECVATIGQVGNVDHENVSIGKAGRSRWLGKRPHVRGVAMNPVDHRSAAAKARRPADGTRVAVGPADQGLQDANRKATDRFIVKRRQK